MKSDSRIAVKNPVKNVAAFHSSVDSVERNRYISINNQPAQKLITCSRWRMSGKCVVSFVTDVTG